MNKEKIIIIDTHAIGSEKGGNETYSYQMARALDDIDHEDVHLLFVAHRNARNYFSLKKAKILFAYLKSFVLRILIFGKICFSLRGNTVLHSQYFFIPYPGIKNVLTIHDVSWKYFERFFTFREKIFFWFVGRCILKADRVMTVSETTKKDILKWYPAVDGNKIRVIPNGANHYSRFNDDNSVVKYDVGAPYILFVSNITSSKNLETSIKVFKGLLNAPKFSHYKMVVVGKKKSAKYFKQISKLIKELALEDKIIFIHHLKAYDFEPMASIYKGASALLHFSFYEGFGFVPLESISLSCVPLVSDCGAIPEVLGADYPLMFDVKDTDAMISGLIRILSDKEMKNNILSEYQDKIKHYTWKDNARATFDVYKELLAR